MFKVYLVESKEWNYDEYDSVVVIASNENEAIELSKDYFKEDQGELSAKEIKLDKSQVVLASYNAG